MKTAIRPLRLPGVRSRLIILSTAFSLMLIPCFIAAEDAVQTTSALASSSALTTVPVLPQISISGQVDTSGNASVSLVFTPLAGLSGDTAAEQQLAILRLSVIHKRLQLQWQSRLALLHHAAVKKHLAVGADIMEARRREYGHIQKQFQEGFGSAADLQNAADQLASSASNRINAMQQKAESEKNLYLLAGKSDIPEEISSVSIDAEQLLQLISEADSVCREISGSRVFTSQDQQTKVLQKSYLEKQLKDTWIFEPAVTVIVSGSVSGAFGSISASLHVAVADINIDELQHLRDQIADLERDLLIGQVSLKIDEQNMKGTLEAAMLSAEIAERNLANMRMVLEQASYDLARKNISEFEYRNVRQSMDIAEANYISALITVYGQLGSLLQSYGDTES